MKDLIVIEGTKIGMDSEGRFSLTDLWKASGSENKSRPNYWQNLQATQEGIEYLKSRDPGFIPIATKSGKNGGTYACKELVYDYAAWLSPEFKFKVYKVFDEHVKGLLKEHDWKRMRHEAASSYKLMSAMVQLTRTEQGKTVEPKHFMCEAKLVNRALKGEFKGLDRSTLTYAELDTLAQLEARNSMLIGHGISYEERKRSLQLFVTQNKKAEENNILAFKQVYSA